MQSAAQMSQTADQMAASQYQRDLGYQNQNDQNVSNATGAYNTAKDQANQAQSTLGDFTKNMQSGTDIYAKQLGLANQNAGYDVNNLNQAQNQVSQLTGIMGGLPRALQASNANYGATAGNVANQYATTGANLNQSLQLANQNAQNQLAKQQAGLSGAQTATSAGIQTQDQQLQGYTAAASNAQQIMSTTQSQMKAMIDAQQAGQQITAQDQYTFGQLKAANAAAQASLAAAQQSLANAANIRQQTTLAQQVADAAAAKKQSDQTAANSKAIQQSVVNGMNFPSSPQSSNSFTPVGNFVNGVASNIGNWWNSLPLY